MKNVLITGGAGYIGSNLIDKLLSKEFKVFALYNNNKSQNIDDNLYWIKYNGSFDSLAKIPQKIDIIVHLATFFSPKHSIDVIKNMINSNILLGIHLLEFAKENNIKSFINTSTYAQSVDKSAYNPQNFYAATKGAFESILKFYTESGVVNNITLSLHDTYGPNDTRPKFINLVLNNLNSDQKFSMSPGEQEIRYVYIDDVTEAFYLSIKLLFSNKISKSQTFSICGKETFTLKELVKHIGNIFGKKIETNLGFYPYRDREIMKCVPKFPKLPGWEPKTNIEQGIKQIIVK